MDLAHDFRGHEPVDRAPLAEPVAESGRRDVEARDRDPLDPPARTGRFGVHVAGPLDKSAFCSCLHWVARDGTWPASKSGGSETLPPIEFP